VLLSRSGNFIELHSGDCAAHRGHWPRIAGKLVCYPAVYCSLNIRTPPAARLARAHNRWRLRRAEGQGSGTGAGRGESVASEAVHAGFEAAAVEARKSLCDPVGKERVVACGDEGFGDAPNIFFSSHPVELVEAREVDGDGVGAKGAFAAQVVVVVEVAESEFAQSAVDGGAEAEAGKVGFGDAAPEFALAVDGEDMIVVVDGLEIDEQGRVAIDAKSGGSEERALEAVAFAFAKNTLR